MAKRILSLLLVLCLALACTACGNNSANKAEESMKSGYDPWRND